MSSVIDIDDKNEQRTEVRVILYSGECIETCEVQDF